MAAPSFAFLLVCMIMSSTIGSELKPCSVPSILNGIKVLNQKVLDLENSVSSIPQTIQAANEEMLLYILDKMANSSKAMREVFETLSNHSLSVEQNLRVQTHLIEKLSQQLENVQNDCTGEPPSPQNGRLVDFERKHGTEVRYRCHPNFVQIENSTVRCHFGKWEGQLPVCTRYRTLGAVLYLRAHMDKHNEKLSNVSCFSEENGRKIRFFHALDAVTGGELPTGARTYSRGREAVLDLAGVPDDDKRGGYECRYEEDGKRLGTTFAIHSYGSFVRPKFARVGDTVMLGVESVRNPSYRWLHDGEHVPAWDGQSVFWIAGVGREDAGVYERFDEGERGATQWFFRLVLRGCPAGFFGELCDEKCPTCRNGGVCHEKRGTCVCAPGFEGQSCELACGRNRFGPNCSLSCDGGDCSYQIFCQPDPYGCTCGIGYAGVDCGILCNAGTFGADCQQNCHCKKRSCDPFTGACSGDCTQGWTGPSCQIPVET